MPGSRCPIPDREQVILVITNDDNDLRIAHALASEPGGRVVLHGPAKSIRYPPVEDLTAVDVVVGRRPDALEVAARAGAAAVIADDVEESPVPTVAGASLLGAGLAMAARMEGEGSRVSRVAIAHPEASAAGNVAVSFPPPVGRQGGSVVGGRPYPVVMASCESPWAALLVEADTGDQALVDDHRFLTAILLAAGIALVPPAGIVKVWDVPGAYLTKAESMGLVAAQRRNS